MKRFYLILTALVLSTIAVTADRWKNYEMNSSEGTEFYVTFMHNNSQATTQSLRLQLFMAARSNTHVWIYEAGGGVYQSFTPITDFYVEGDTCWDYPNSTNIYLDESDHIFRSVRVVTDSAISLYAASSGGQIGDATMVLPVTRLGREYVAQTPQNNIQVNELAIIATEPGITNLTITPSTDITITVQSSHAAGVPYTVALSQGDIYYATSTDETGDLSGTMVCADRNVAVFNGCQSTKVLGYGKSSHVCHQALPTNLWGTRYALVMFEGFQLNAVKFTALYDHTEIRKNGQLLTTLNRFQSYNYQWNDGQTSAFFETSKQTECYQYMPANGLYGAPAMAMVPALDQGVQSLRISSFEFTSPTYQAYVNIVLPTSAVDSMMVDSVYVGSQFAPLTGLTGYSFAVIELTAGEHDLTNKKGRFTAIAYSQDDTELSFVYNAGLNCMDEYAYILVDGQRLKKKTICVSTDGMWHFNATSVVQGDYGNIEWYDEQNGLWNRKSGDSIWHAGLTSEGLHNVMMLVHKTSPVCGYETIDTVSVEIYNVPSINPVREVMEVCKTDVIDVFGKAISCDTLIVNQIYNFKKMYTNLYGCDSLVTQPVIVLERADSTFNDTICEGDVYIFHDREYTDSGTYIVLDSIGHCPYTDTLNLMVNPTYRFTERDTICQDKLPYSWPWHYEINSDSAGTFTYHDSLKTHLGCDSLYELILTIGEVYLITDTIYECDNHLPYEWHGRQFTETGVYYDSLTSRFGCDSVHRLMLTVSESYLSVNYTNICSNDVVTWRDSVYSGFEEGETVIYDSLVSSMGCDSVYANVLTVRRADIFYTDTTICDNDTVHWREHIISGNKVKEIPAGAEVVDSGYHLISDSMINIVGCDSVYHLRLTVNRSYEETVERVICQGENYEFDNMTLTWRNDVAGVYDSTVTYTTAEGCDSVLNLHLTVNPTYHIEFYDTVCNNNSYHWYSGEIDTLITERTSGMYDFHVTFQTVAGCDSTHTLHLTVLDTVAIPSTAFIPDKGSYVWDNERYGGVKSADVCDHVLPASPTPYFFRHVYTAANGCDSILTLTIKVDETYDRTLNVTTCQHDDYDFNGTPWSWKKDIPGDHDTIYEYRTIAGYDSIWRMHLHVNPVYLLQQKDSTCRNVPYTWAGHRQTYQNLSPGIHLMYDSLFTKSGCDSVYELSLTVLDTAENVTVISIPDNNVIMWDGMLIAGSKYRGHADVYLEDGVYDFHNTYTSTSCGCDSVMHLYLTVTYTFCDSVSVTTCQHEEYVFNGQTWQWGKDEAGLHDTAYVYRSTAGYDSVWRLQLTVIPVYLIEESGSTCENVPYTWKGHRKTFSGLQPGIYTFYDSLKSVVANCDSIYRLTLTVNDTVEHIEYITICDNEEVTWDGETFHGGKLRTGNGRECPARTEPYQFAHQYETTNTHCDSTERLVLYVKPTYEFRRDTMLCSKHGFEFHDTVYTESGTYYDSLRTASGCDSVYVLNLTLDHSTITRQYIGVCEGDSFMFRGKTVKEPGIYIDSLISVVGQCDSIIELHFDILPTYYIRDTVQICDGDSILWHGQCLKYAGTYYDSQKTHSGCDSIYERHVIVAPKFHNIEHDTVCSNQEYHWRGKWFSESGVYFDSMKSRHGCDSVYELRLTLFRPSVYEQYAEICQGGSYTFRGKRITQPGVYYDTIYSVHGCDSIYKLVLNYTQTYHYRDTAQICDGGLLIWRGKNIHQAGTYFDSLKTESGCDSIFELYVRILPKFHDIAYDTVCTNKTYHWRGKWLTEGGIYFDTIKGHYGCDSVYEMRLTMFRPYVYEEYAEVCQGGAYNFRGRQITEAGVYYDTMFSVHGCDSVYKLVLNFAKTYNYRDTVQICDGEVYQWHNKTIIYGGTYRDTLKTVGSGCDSIFEIFVRVAPKFHNIEYDTVCSAQTYHWRGKWLTETGTYFDTLKSSQGCDSVYEMRLTMFRPYVYEEYAEVCQGGSFAFRGRVITQPGTYYDSLTSRHGCDSIYKLVLNIAKTYYFRDTVQICDGEVYQWHNKSIIYGGTYRDTLKTAGSGCDSIFEVFVRIAPKFHNIEYDTVCSAQTYHWRGKWLTETGTYFDTLKSSQGCDSVYEMRLTMFRPYVYEEYAEVCQGGSFAFRGRVITQPGTYYDSLTSRHGCDSIYKLVLNIAKTYYFRDTVQICDGEVYQWHNKSIIYGGTYRDTLKTVGSSCDSIFEVFVRIAPKFHNIEYDTVCSAQTYHWRGKWLTETGTYFDTLKSSQGCDSVYEMRLIMGVPTVTEHYIEVCEGGHFDFRGRKVTESGIYYDTLISRHGCDSIIKLVFNVTRSYRFYETIQICDGDVYQWHGYNIHQAGTYRDSLKTMTSGCDSIYEMFVTVAPKFHNISYDTVCTDQTYWWRGKWLTSGGTYFDSIVGSQGCDSVYELRLVMGIPTVTEHYIEVCEGDYFDFRGKRITEPGVYFDTLISRFGCDSVFKLVFNVTRSYRFYETIQICDGDVYQWHGYNIHQAGTYRDSLKTMASGCDSIYEIFVTVAPKFHNIDYDTVCSDSVYHWRGKWLTESGTYYDSIADSQGCDSVYEMRLSMFRPTIHEQYVEVCQGGSFDFRGKEISQSGTYYDTLTSVHGCDSIYKLVLNFTKTYYFHDTVMICDGDVYNFRGRPIRYAGTYRDTLKTVGSGCDSIYEIHVKMAPTFHNIAYDTVFSNLAYQWRGKWLTETGTYFDTLKSHWGCDSVYEMRLTMYQPSIYEEYVEICEGSSYFFRGHIITEPGTYYDTLITTHGYDSVFKLILNISHKYYFRDTTYLCDGNTYYFRGRPVTHAGTYRDTLKTIANDCDSIYEVCVLMAPQFHDIAYDSLCGNGTYHWRGKWLTETGVYYDTLKSSWGCDSVYEMRLTMFNPSIHEEYIEVCEGGSFDFRGRRLTEPGTYYDSLTNVHGCDSIYKLVFNIAKTYYFRDTTMICDGDYYDFYGKRITHEGTYRDTLKTVSGCDSIHEIFVKVQPKFHNIDYDTVCSDSVYHWRGKWLTKSGTYFDSLKSHWGCDSVYEMRLVMGVPTVTELYIEVCEGDSFDFRGRRIIQPDVLYDTLVNRHGCDSIVKIVFNVTRKYHFYESRQICDSSSYSWHGRNIRKAGTYYDSLTTVNSGCDSIYELSVTVAPKFHNIAYDTVCSDTVYHWRGKWLSRTGNYFDTLLSRNGCDSVYELRLIVYSQNMTTVNLQLCNGNVITINGRRITTPGIYYDTLMRNSFGCDSIIKYVVSTPPNYIHEDTVYICEGSSYTFFGQTFNMPGTYYHTVPQAAPLCDEIYKLVLKTHERYYTVIDTTICANTVLIFNGTRITTSGTYYENYTTIYGCDSIRELNVTVNQPSYYTERVDICQKQSFRTPTGKILNTRGVFNDTLLNHVGCDSILTYIVNVYDNIRISDTLLICRGGSGVARNGLTYSAAGDYVDTVNRNTANGCDTMFFTHVAYDVTQVAVPATICNGDTFMFHGTAYTHAGTYTLFEQSMTAGICDVLYTITVTVNQVPHTLLVDTTCDNTPYAFNGNLLTVSGTYRDTLMAANGCDSIVTLNLTVFDSLTVDSTVTICDKDSLLWFGRWYKYDGVYHHTTVSPSSGCNIYHTLYLTTIKETQLVSVNNQEMCQDEDEYFITPTFAGTAPTRFTLRYDGVSVPSSNDLVDEWYDGSSITVPIPRTADGKRITPDNYTVTLQIGNDNCGMGRQTMNFNLLVKYPSYLLEQHFNDVVSVLNYKYNGGYSFEDYRWYVNGTKVANADKSNLYDLHLSPNDVVYAELRRKGESYFIPTCEITIVDLGQDDIDYPIAVVSGRTTAQVTAMENATYRLCTISGVTLQSGELAKNEVVNLNLPYVAGCYLFVVDAETAGRKVFRLVVH